MSQSGSTAGAFDAHQTNEKQNNSPNNPGRNTIQRARIAAIGGLAATALHASAASISAWQFSVDDTDTISFTMGSVITSTLTNRIGRFRVDAGTISKMTLGVVPNTNIVGVDTSAWFTTRDAPYRVGRADLGTVSGDPAYFAPLATPYDDLTLGPDNALWATNAGSGTLVRITRAGVATMLTGDGTIRPRGIARGNDAKLWFADGDNRRITRIDPETGAVTHYPVPQISAGTIPERVTAIPESATIWFATDDGFGSVDPATGSVQVAPTEPQQPKRIAAGADGTVWLTSGTQYVTQFTPPSNYAKLKVFSDSYAQSSGIYVDASGAVFVTDRWNAMLVRIGTAAETPADTTVAEFYNSGLNHYFVTADPVEAASIDNGVAGPGWVRTGQSWRGWLGGPIPNAAEVCRFYGSADVDPTTGSRHGPNSHFYTLDPAECAAVKRDAGWTYEQAAKFWMMRPVNGACPPATQPVRRAYNNRYAANDSNHRYTVSEGVYDEMVAKGWSGEGVVMCAPSG